MKNDNQRILFSLKNSERRRWKWFEEEKKKKKRDLTKKKDLIVEIIKGELRLFLTHRNKTHMSLSQS